MVRMDGTTPDAGLLNRIRSGEVGGVILYADNITSAPRTRQLVSELQQASKAGGNPPLLISTDQEGGQVKRLPWAPPDVSPPQMGEQGPSVSEQQGQQTGTALRNVGINVDLAPVLDVAHSPSSFIWQQGRSFGITAPTVTNSAVPFARGMENARVAPTAKHFPGVGGALTDTDYGLQKITLEREDLAPYEAVIAQDVPLIMVSTAVYVNRDPAEPAALSHDIVTGLLRHQLGFQGVVITDDLERPTETSTSEAAVRSVNAGVDVVLVSTTESSGVSTYKALLDAAQRGEIPRVTLDAAYQRIAALKARYVSSQSPN